MDQTTPPSELLAHAPKQKLQHETHVVDQAGHRVVALLRVTFLNLAFELFAAARARNCRLRRCAPRASRRRGDMRNPGCGGRHINIAVGFSALRIVC
jgi:hypothetical protein